MEGIYMLKYDWFALLYGRNQHNIVMMKDWSEGKMGNGQPPGFCSPAF